MPGSSIIYVSPSTSGRPAPLARNGGDPLPERQKEVGKHLRKAPDLVFSVLSDNLKISLLSRPELRPVDAVADRQRANLNEVRKHAVQMMALRKLADEPHQFALVFVCGRIELRDSALATHRSPPVPVTRASCVSRNRLDTYIFDACKCAFGQRERRALST